MAIILRYFYQIR